MKRFHSPNGDIFFGQSPPPNFSLSRKPVPTFVQCLDVNSLLLPLKGSPTFTSSKMNNGYLVGSHSTYIVTEYGTEGGIPIPIKGVLSGYEVIDEPWTRPHGLMLPHFTKSGVHYIFDTKPTVVTDWFSIMMGRKCPALKSLNFSTAAGYFITPDGNSGTRIYWTKVDQDFVFSTKKSPGLNTCYFPGEDIELNFFLSPMTVIRFDTFPKVLAQLIDEYISYQFYPIHERETFKIV